MALVRDDRHQDRSAGEEGVVGPGLHAEMGDAQDQMRTQESWDGISLPSIAQRQTDQYSGADRETHTHPQGAGSSRSSKRSDDVTADCAHYDREDPKAPRGMG